MFYDIFNIILFYSRRFKIAMLPTSVTVYDISEILKGDLKLGKESLFDFFSDIIHEIKSEFSKEEKVIIENILLEHPNSILLINEEVKHMKTLKRYDLIYRIDDDLFTIDPQLINAYNEVVLQGQYKSLQLLTDEERLTLGGMILNDEYRENLKDIKLVELLETYKNETLKQICRLYNIKGFSNKNKIELCELISSEFFKDTVIIERILVETFSFALLIELLSSDRNSIKDVSVDNINQFPFIVGLFDRFGSIIAVLPSDVRKYIENNFDIQAMMNQFQGFNTNSEIEVFVYRALQIYGAVEIKQIQKLFKQYLQLDISKNEIKALFDDKDEGLVYKNYIVHPFIRDDIEEFITLIIDVPYFVPENYERFKVISDQNENDQSLEMQAFLKFFKNHLLDKSESNKVEMEIFLLIMLASAINEEHIKLYLQNLEENQIISKMPRKKRDKLLNKISPQIRRWIYRGHNLKEYKEVTKSDSKNVINFNQFKK